MKLLLFASIAVASFAAPAHAQALRTLTMDSRPEQATTICGQAVPPPAAVPAPGSGPVVYLISPCFDHQGGKSRTAPFDYLRDIHLRPSRPSSGDWTPYDAAAEQVILADFQRLWKNHPLTDLSIEVRDYAFSNGVIGKLVIYDMIERN